MQEQLEKQRKVLNYRFRERCEQMCKNLQDELDSAVNQQVKEQVKLREQQINKRLTIEHK